MFDSTWFCLVYSTRNYQEEASADFFCNKALLPTFVDGLILDKLELRCLTPFVIICSSREEGDCYFLSVPHYLLRPEMPFILEFNSISLAEEVCTKLEQLRKGNIVMFIDAKDVLIALLGKGIVTENPLTQFSLI